MRQAVVLPIQTAAPAGFGVNGCCPRSCGKANPMAAKFFAMQPAASFSGSPVAGENLDTGTHRSANDRLAGQGVSGRDAAQGQ
jgi:hypothetical protein